jgi:hypothetical protein
MLFSGGKQGLKVASNHLVQPLWRAGHTAIKPFAPAPAAWRYLPRSAAPHSFMRQAEEWNDPWRTNKASVLVMVVHPPVQDDPRRFLALVARFALAVMTLLVALCALASAMMLLVVVFALGHLG